MQTFLPYSNFILSAHCLDRQRLGKQRVEVLQLLRAINTGGSWSKHPCAKMWKGFEKCLGMYGVVICDEWIKRGYKDTCRDKIITELGPNSNILLPTWLGNEDFHASHRSNLLRKNPDWYKQFNWIEPDNLSYIWPEN